MSDTNCRTVYTPCSHTNYCINRNLKRILEGKEHDFPDFCNTTVFCVTNYLKTLEGYTATGNISLGLSNNEFVWQTSPTVYTDAQAIAAVGVILSPEFLFDSGVPSISINQIDWSKIVNAPSTPTLQEVFAIQGSTALMTGDNEIDGGGFDFTFNNVDKIFMKEGSAAGASSGFVWTLVNNSTGEGAWLVSAGGGGGGGSSVLQSVQSGDGLTLTFNIAHGLVGTPKVHITPIGQDSSGIGYITVDATNIIIHYDIAPPTGTNNLIFNWSGNL